MKAHLCVSASTQNLAAIRAWLAEQTRAAGIAPDDLDKMILAVDECAANIVLHGYQNRDGEIALDLEHHNDMWLVRLRDQAPPFDPTRVPFRDPQDAVTARVVGGWGIHLARHMTDEMRYRRTLHGENELTLIWHHKTRTT